MKKNMTNLMYIPALLLFIVFVFYPFLDGIRISMTDWNGFSRNYNYIGLENYVVMLADNVFRRTFVVTLIYGIGSTLFQQILGLSYAVLLNNNFRGKNLTRTIVYLPVLLPGVIMGYMYYFLVQYNRGAFNDVIMLFGLDKINWLGNGSVAIAIILLMNIIQFSGVSMVILLAGLQGIPKMYYEAATIDGASKFQLFKNITLPMLYPALLTSITINLIGGLKLFGPIKALTGGGPGYASHSISTYIHKTYFQVQLAGYSAAMGFVLFLFISFFTVGTLKFSSKKEVTY